MVEKGNIREERLYLGNYERYRKYVNNILKTERQTLHIIDDRHRFALIDRLTIDNGITLSTATNSIRYQYDNHLGSASLELDQTAAIISYEEYHPYGTTSYRSGRTETEVSQKRYKYVGKERDEETGLYYYGARYYAAWLCRFVSVDPLQFRYPHYTPYQYAGNKPVSYIDLDGLEENKTIELNWKISEQIDARPELRVPMDEIWGIGRFGGLNLGIVSEKGIESKDGKYTIHGIESGPNKGNWLVREHYENGDYKNLVVAGPEAFKEVRSGKFSERGTALNLIAAGEMLGADPTSTYRENILNGWKEAWEPENIVSSLLLAIAVIKTPLSGMVRKVGGNAAKTVGQGFNSFSAFKRVMGPAGSGQAWHHIVEQTPGNIAKFGNQAIHNTTNLMKLPNGAGSIHAKLSGHYSSKQFFTNGQTVRQWLSTKSYQEQYDYGIKMLKQFGWIP